jgi:hypothetical protein
LQWVVIAVLLWLGMASLGGHLGVVGLMTWPLPLFAGVVLALVSRRGASTYDAGREWQRVLAENHQRLLAEARVLLDPRNQSREVQDMIVGELAAKYFPPIWTEGGDVTYWTYSFGWRRDDEGSSWQPIVQLTQRHQGMGINGSDASSMYNLYASLALERAAGIR